MIKIKKTKKSKKQRGNTRYGRGARKKGKGKGHQGGKGMAGTGKRADQKKSKIIGLYGNKYFGKQGITSKRTQKNKGKVINLKDIQKNIESYQNKNKEIELKKYKVLGDGEITEKLTIKALSFTKKAVEKIEKAGGKAISLRKKVENSKEKIEKKRENAKPEA